MSLDKRIRTGTLVEVFDFPDINDRFIGVVIEIHRNIRDNFIVILSKEGIVSVSLDLFSSKIIFIQGDT